jgi:transcription initiation factor TFIID TATA-box-binding protein
MWSSPLETIAIGLGLEQTEYEPEQFPGLIYRDGESTVLVFASGKIVCTGLTNLEEILSAIDNLTHRIESFAVS